MAKPNHIELPTGEKIPILYEDRAVLALDKPRGWMLVPFSWQKTNRNLQAALTSSIAARDFWARSRSIRFLKFIHRLDADTTGILLFAKSQGAVSSYGALFEDRAMDKLYLAVVPGTPKEREWTCRLSIGTDPQTRGKMKVDGQEAKTAETHFTAVETVNGCTLIEARPHTGRTHQIRLHLAAAGIPILGDELYSKQPPKRDEYLALRAIRLAFPDPFNRKRVEIRASAGEFLREHGFAATLPNAAGNVEKVERPRRNLHQ